MERGLNTDIPKSIAEFEAIVHELLPKEILYRILFRGKGLEFDGYREFGQDEDASNIDWKASIRSTKLLARQYIEERDVKFAFIVDMGENMVFGSQEKLKCEYASEMLAALSHVVINTGDMIGFVLFNEKIFHSEPPKSGTKQHDIFVHEITTPENYKGTCDFSEVLNDLVNILDPSIDFLFIVSDFLKVNEEHKEILESLGNMFEVVALCVKDPLDSNLPDINEEVVIEDIKSGEKILINPKLARGVYNAYALEHEKNLRKMFNEANIDLLELSTDKIFAPLLAEFLKKRVERSIR